ncbi:PREDICTED: uncharacterized protein C2orf61 homolog [Tinamus guttatus]|uniref:uncharacterized protein C2orf61 homolog n=1 Tax=Tinamus guttatus TaxID=94827 RepID=UPI00052E6E0C|nr:PREDICTED: uncharacterized protein C2orf61 homolog [Tinamus guttatus]
MLATLWGRLVDIVVTAQSNVPLCEQPLVQIPSLLCPCLPTPTPGTYAVRDFLQEAQLNPVKPTYSFKGEGRRRTPIYERAADNSLPSVSAYVPPTFVDLARKKLATYSFKSLPRRSPSTLCFKDKDINTAPGQYDISSPPVSIFASNEAGRPDSVSARLLIARAGSLVSAAVEAEFKSSRLHLEVVQALMFSSLDFNVDDNHSHGKEGPGPGHYEVRREPPRTVCSCFQSKVPRMLPVRSDTPGPGSYEPTRQFPKQPRTIASLGQEHSIFFSSAAGF